MANSFDGWSLDDTIAEENLALDRDEQSADQPAIRFEALEPRVLLSGDINPGVKLVSGALQSPGQQDQYHFTLDQSQRVVFDSLTYRGDLHWILSGADGKTITRHDFNKTDSAGSQSVYKLDAGTYSLAVSGDGDATGAYALRLIDGDAGADLFMGEQTNGSLTQDDQTHVFRFDATAGQKFSLVAGAVSGGGAGWRLIDPWGRQEGSARSLDAGTSSFVAQTSGQYLLLVEGHTYNSSTATYNFRFDAVTDTDVTLSLDQIVSTAGTQPGQTNNYHFTVDDDSHVLFDSLQGSGYQWSLTGSQGEIVKNRMIGGHDDGGDRLALVAGTYTLSITGHSGASDAYAFQLLTKASVQSLALGDVVDAALVQGSGSAIYQIALTQGQRLAMTGSATTNLHWRLLDSVGDSLANGNLGEVTTSFEVSTSGNYWLVVAGNNSDVAKQSHYELSLNTLPDVDVTLALGALIQGNIAQVGQRAL